MHFKETNMHLNMEYSMLRMKTFFWQFLDLNQEELSILEYPGQFSRLQDACGLEDDEEHYLISFLRRLGTGYSGENE